MDLKSIQTRLERHFEQNLESKSVLITLVKESSYKRWFDVQDKKVQNWLKFNDLKIKHNSFLLLPDLNITPPISGVVAIVNDSTNALVEVIGLMSRNLPPATYSIVFYGENPDNDNCFALAWGLGAYRFPFTDKDNNKQVPKLIAKIDDELPAIWLGRELINQPANILSPEKLANVVLNLNDKYCQVTLYEGKTLDKDFPLTSVVAKSGRAGKAVEISYQKETKAKKVMKITLIGKGVTFDSGGLNLKPTRAMALMKKDMGGAAHAISSFILLRQLDLPIKLKLIVVCADNMINHESFRPGDILTAKNGTTVEIADTDAEGRLLLADALIKACEDKPDLIIDFATLTGAARVALGTDIPNVFSNYNEFMEELKDQAFITSDPIWRMPLWQNYHEDNRSLVADISNSPSSGYGGAITAALFLQHFLPKNQKWLHFDVMAWSLKNKPLSPIGGEIQGVRALVKTIKATVLQK